MLVYITRRFLLLILVLFGASLLLFGIFMTFSPERRAAAYVTSPQQAKDIPRIIEQFGLDDPFYLQYLRWLKELVITSYSIHYTKLYDAERPVNIIGNLRGTEKAETAGAHDIAKFAVEISADTFYSRTFTIDHQ